MIGVPTRGSITVKTVKSLTALRDKHGLRPIEFAVHRHSVARCRELLRLAFLASDADVLLSVDDDMDVPDTILDTLDDALAQADVIGYPLVGVRSHGPTFNFTPTEAQPQGELFPADYIWTSIFAVKRTVMESIKFRDGSNLDHWTTEEDLFNADVKAAGYRIAVDSRGGRVRTKVELYGLGNGNTGNVPFYDRSAA